MVKTFCKVIGIIFLIVGVMGFIAPTMLGFHLTAVHNIIHIISGAVALYFGYAGSLIAARSFCITFGVIYLLLGILGYIAPRLVSGILMTDADSGADLHADNIFHILLGLVFIVVWYLDAQRRTAAKTT